MLKVKKKLIKEVNIGGKGGKERIISKCFVGLTREDHPLYDAVDKAKEKHEFKKQANLQWFDTGKYYNLSEEERRIWVNFLLHEQGKIQSVYSIRLGELIQTLTSDPEYHKDGWTMDSLRQDYEMKQKYPSKQVKTRLKVKQFVKKYSNKVKKIY